MAFDHSMQNLRFSSISNTVFLNMRGPGYMTEFCMNNLVSCEQETVNP